VTVTYSMVVPSLISANPLPQPITNATIVPFGDSFLLVGGETVNDDSYILSLSTIYHYGPEEDSWTLLDGRMSEEKCNVIAMLVDRNAFLSE
jgi:N-acetylneuraminic acid mutarotase